MKSLVLALAVVSLALLVLWLAKSGSPVEERVAVVRESSTSARDVDVAHALENDSSAAEHRVVPASPPQAPSTTDHVASVSQRTVTSENGAIVGRVLDRTPHGASPHAAKLTLHYDIRPQDDLVVVGAVNWTDRSLDVPDSGEFEVEGLAMGTWVVTCSIPHHISELARILLTPTEPRVGRDFVLRPTRAVHVALHDESGRPLIAALLREGSALGEQLGAFVCSSQPTLGASPCPSGSGVVSRASVRGKGDADPWCDIEVESREVVWVSVAIGDHTLAFHDVQPGEEEVTLVVSRDRLRAAMGSAEITVLDESSAAPIEKALVRLGGTEAETDAKGSATFDNVLPGDVRAVVLAEGHVLGSRTIEITSGKTTRAELRLEPSITISGTFMSSNGAARSGRVRAVMLGVEKPQPRDMLAGPDGSFAFQRLPHGEYVLADSRSTWPSPLNASTLKEPLPKGFVRVDARAGSVSNVVVVAESLDAERGTRRK